MPMRFACVSEVRRPATGVAHPPLPLLHSTADEQPVPFALLLQGWNFLWLNVNFGEVNVRIWNEYCFGDFGKLVLY